MRYPEENSEGRALFLALEESAKCGRYDDEFLAQLVAYRRMYPESEHFDIFYGKYAAFHGNYRLALEHGKKAYKKRKVCLEVWNLLIECYLALGEPEKAVPFQGYCNRFYGVEPGITVPVEKLTQCLGELSVAMGIAAYAPLCKTRCSLEGGRFSSRAGVFCGESLPFSLDREGYAYWVGAYNELGMLGGHGGLLEGADGLWKFHTAAGADFTYDIMRSKVGRETIVDPKGGEVILPVAAASRGNQEVEFSNAEVKDSSTLGQWEYGFFRIDRPTRIASEQPLAFGRPIRLGHSSSRRKLVLNILVDGLSWNVLRSEGFRHLEAFSECDQFLFLHLMECHPWSSKSFPVGMGAQTKLSLGERLRGKERKVPSVYLPNSLLYQTANRQAMEHVDRSLRMLFGYITEHYREDEFLVQLYSDHGVPIYDETPSVLSDNQTNAAYMMRGHGVPEKGMVEELTSAVDIYPSLAMLAGFPVGEWVDGNLPAALGGKARECVYSNSLFPGQTYKLCIRTQEYEFTMESREPVNEDGTADLSGAEFSVRTRTGSRRAVEDPGVIRHFLGRAGEYTAHIHHGGRQWRSLVEARPEWYGKAAEN